MKGIDFIDALSQIDPELANSYLNDTSAAEQKTTPDIAVTKAVPLPAEHPRRLKLLSAVGMLGSAAACAALVFGFWKLSTPELTYTEQNSDVSVISMDAESTDDSAAEVTSAAASEAVTAASAASEKASSKTTAAPVQTAAVMTKAAEQKTNSDQKTSAAQTSAPASGKTDKTSTQATPSQTQKTTAKTDDQLPVPSFVGLSVENIMDRFRDTYMISVENGSYSKYDTGIVYEQSIPKGTKIAANEVIRLKSSRGIRPEQSIPDVCGMEQKQAERAIREAGYNPLSMWSNFTEEPYGTVFRMKECDDGNVLLYVSNGIGGKMPDLVGMLFEDAQSKYCNAVEIHIAGYVESNRYPGVILEQSVEPGADIKRDFDFNTPNHDCTKVYVTIAGSGSLLEPVGNMPDLVGKVVNAAMPENIEELSTILHSDVQGTFIFDSASDAPAGTVLSQYPAPGEPVWHNENVIVSISRPEPSNEEFVSLPDLTGKPLSEAIGEIRSKGCEPFIGKKVYRPDLPDFTVIETEPGDLSHVRQGSGVRVIISVSKRQLADAE